MQSMQATLNSGVLSLARRTRSLALRILSRRMLLIETVVIHAVAEVDEAEEVVLAGAVLRAARSLEVLTKT